MKEGQDRIYYVTAETLPRGEEQPAPRDLPQEGASRCCSLSDRVDEWVVAHLPEFDGKPLVSVARGELDLGKLETDDESEGGAQAGRCQPARWSAGSRKRSASG